LNFIREMVCHSVNAPTKKNIIAREKRYMLANLIFLIKTTVLYGH
jgi:hypothetical protein